MISSFCIVSYSECNSLEMLLKTKGITGCYKVGEDIKCKGKNPQGDSRILKQLFFENLKLSGTRLEQDRCEKLLIFLTEGND